VVDFSLTYYSLFCYIQPIIKQALIIHFLNGRVDLTRLEDDPPVVLWGIVLSKGPDNALIEERGSGELFFTRSF